jgi:hypothetical protein
MARYFLSDLMSNGALVRQAHDTGEHSVTAVIKIPSGTDLAVDDELKIGRFAANLNITEILVRSEALESAGNTLACEIGYVIPSVNPAIAYDATTNPAVTGGIGTASDAYYSAAAAAPFQDGGVYKINLAQDLDNEFATNPTNGVAGIIDLTVSVSTASGGAVAADKYVWVTVSYTGAMQTPTDSYDYTAPY